MANMRKLCCILTIVKFAELLLQSLSSYQFIQWLKFRAEWRMFWEMFWRCWGARAHIELRGTLQNWYIKSGGKI